MLGKNPSQKPDKTVKSLRGKPPGIYSVFSRVGWLIMKLSRTII
jgi:hypothetical protein